MPRRGVEGKKKKLNPARYQSQPFSPLPRHGDSWLSSQASPVPGTTLAQHTSPHRRLEAKQNFLLQRRVYGIRPRKRGPCSSLCRGPLHSVLHQKVSGTFHGGETTHSPLTKLLSGSPATPLPMRERRFRLRVHGPPMVAGSRGPEK